MEQPEAISSPAEARASQEPPVAARFVRRLCVLAVSGFVVWLAAVGIEHIYWQHPDFKYFYNGGNWLLTRGSIDPGYDVVAGQAVRRGSLDWYWPAVPRLMTLLALMPIRTAGYVWLALNLVALVATLRLLGRYLVGLPPQDWAVTQLLPALVLAPYWLWEFRLNQIDVLTLLLVVGSFVCWERGRGAIAGFWLGLAVLLKLTPGLLVLWFALKRETRTVSVAVLTVVLAGPVSDTIVFGPDDTLANYRGWANRAVTTGSHRGLILAQREVDWRNQGLGAVLSRWLYPTNYNTHFDNDPQIQAEYVGCEPRSFNIATLPLRTVADIALVVIAGTLAGLVWLVRRPAQRLTRWQLRFEWALFVLAMLWMMPVLRRYHMIAALPAIALLGAGIHHSGFHSGWAKLALACIGLALLMEFTLLSIPLEATGAILASVAILALPLVVMLLRLQRQPATLPQAVVAHV